MRSCWRVAPSRVMAKSPRCFGGVGVHDFVGAARHILGRPYGRIRDREKFWLVLSEGCGTCTTKHALLAELGQEQGIDIQLTLGIYEMSATMRYPKR
jgi:hypothetical protein